MTWLAGEGCSVSLARPNPLSPALLQLQSRPTLALAGSRWARNAHSAGIGQGCNGRGCLLEMLQGMREYMIAGVLSSMLLGG